MRRLYEFIRWQ